MLPAFIYIPTRAINIQNRTSKQNRTITTKHLNPKSTPLTWVFTLKILGVKVHGVNIAILNVVLGVL
jgi:hypothetical protein